MNRFITAITEHDLPVVKEFLRKPKWREWSEPSGKNALHYLCGVRPQAGGDGGRSLTILKLLLNSGLGMNSVQRVEEKNCIFPATPLWYAYTHGRNEKLYKYLLKNGADPSNCWWAIAWYDDVKAGNLWLRHGATIDNNPSHDELFLGAVQWKKNNFARWMLKRGANVNARGPGRMTALILAVKRKDEDAIKWLAGAGADPDIEDETGLSARNIAEEKGPRRILRHLECR